MAYEAIHNIFRIKRENGDCLRTDSEVDTVGAGMAKYFAEMMNQGYIPVHSGFLALPGNLVGQPHQYFHVAIFVKEKENGEPSRVLAAGGAG